MTQPQPNQAVGKYEFLGVVDKPKAGVTYKVRNLATGEFEALRALPGGSYGDPEMRERFLREIRIHTRLSHPNIVAFHDALELDGQLVMTAEFVEGTTLAEFCRRGPLSQVQAIRAGHTRRKGQVRRLRPGETGIRREPDPGRRHPG
jgi:serine/threonine-protein kinase